MLHSPAEQSAITAVELPDIVLDSSLESTIARVEQRLGSLSESLRLRDVQSVESQAQALHAALTHAVAALVHAARHGGVPSSLRVRLGGASAELARQRETLARATASLDRAIDVLMPDAHPAQRGLYSATGRSVGRGKRGGTFTA